MNRRSSDRGWRGVLFGRENWYRDFWLLVITGLALVGIIVAVSAARDATDAAKTARNAAAAAKRTAEQIQRSRIEIARTSCLDQNERHDKTIIRLRQLVDKIPDPDRRAQSRANIEATISLIDALVPKRDCGKLVARLRIKTKPKTQRR